MRYRVNTFFERKSYSSDATEIIDLKMSDLISAIVLRVDQTAASATMTAHPMAGVKKIELVDGSDVLFSLDGYEAEALDWYHNKGNFRANWNMWLNGSTHSRYIGLHFGRWLCDPEYALDPRRFGNLQLKVSMDIDAGGLASSAVYLTGYAYLFDEASASPKGFLMAKELKSYTMASATHDYTDMPLDYPYRALYFRPFLLGTEPNQCVSNIKLSEDQDKRRPFDLSIDELMRIIMAKYPEVVEPCYFVIGTSNKYIYCTPSSRVVATGAYWGATGVTNEITFYDGDGGRLKTIGASTGGNANIVIRGVYPHCVFEIPFGNIDNPADFYDVRKINSLKLDITGGAASTGYVFLEQVRGY